MIECGQGKSLAAVRHFDVPFFRIMVACHMNLPGRKAICSILDRVFYQRLNDQLRDSVVCKLFFQIKGIGQTILIADPNAVEILLHIIHFFPKSHHGIGGACDIAHDSRKLLTHGGDFFAFPIFCQNIDAGEGVIVEMRIHL